MKHWNTISAVLRLALFAVIIYLGYQVTVVFVQDRNSTKYYEDYYEDPKDRSSAQTVDGRIVELKRSANQGNPGIKGMLFHQLLLQAQFFPERSEEPLNEAIALGKELYKDFEPMRAGLGDNLAVAYLLAGLPGQFPGWIAEVTAQTPFLRPRLNFLQVHALVMMDDLAGARALIENELAGSAGNQEYLAYTMASYLVLDDIAAAQEAGFEGLGDEDERSDIRWAHALLLLESRDFEAAAAQFRILVEQSPSDPDNALPLATALAAINGLDDSEVRELLWTATGSTRYPRSIVGAEAEVCASLYSITDDVQWLERLRELRRANPTDFQAIAQLALASLEPGYLAPATPVAANDAAASPPEQHEIHNSPVELARAALELATSEYERQTANLLLARAYVHSVYATEGSADFLELALLHFRRTLGDPNEAGAVTSQRLPDYSYFLLDPELQQVRSKFQRFDQEVNMAITGFLKAREKRYGIVDVPDENTGQSDQVG